MDGKGKLARIIAAAAAFAGIFAAERLSAADGLLFAVLYVAVYLFIGFDVIFNAVKNIIHGKFFDECFLMSLATAGAIFIGEYGEAVAVMLFYQTGEFFCDAAVDKSKKSINEILKLRPDSVTVIRNGAEIVVSPEDIGVGETISVKPGEKIALDGEIVEGNARIDTSSLTGEAVPRRKSAGDTVLGGCVNLEALIKIRVTKRFDEGTQAKIIELIQNSSEKKARTENFITRFSKIYTPCVVAGAILLCVLPTVFFHGEFELWFRRALTFLVVSCPCALVVSIPLSFFGGIGGAALDGILIKGSNHIEALSKVSTAVFDKTGTLTKGTFSVTEIHPINISEKELLEIAATAESKSSHPIAKSIMSACGGETDISRIGRLSEQAGYGICAEIDGEKVLVGSEKLMAREKIVIGGPSSADTTVHVARAGKYLGYIVISDEIKPEAEKAIAELRSLGVKKTVMLTGDGEAVGRAVAEKLGIDDVKAGLLPDGKAEALEKLIEEKPRASTLLFAGDGINDAPVIMRADVGVAMGGVGSDAAIEASDVVLTDDDPEKLAKAVKISRKTMRIVRENIVFSIGVKAIVLILAAFGVADMWLAVTGDVGVLIVAVINALRTLKN